MYGVWLAVFTTLTSAAESFHLGTILTRYGISSAVAGAEALALLRQNCSATAASAALFASVTFVHHFGAAGRLLRTPLFTPWPFFVAAPLAYFVSVGVGLLVAFLIDWACLDIGASTFLEGARIYVGPEDFGRGMLNAGIYAAVLGTLAAFALPKLQRSVPGYWRKIGVVWLAGLLIGFVSAAARCVASPTG
jgi:hypothetical protein